MKATLFVVLIVALCGVLGWRYYERERSSGPVGVVETKPKPGAGQGEQSDSLWDVRAKARTVGDSLDDVRIIAVIKGKYVMDSDLSVFAISVDCHNGAVNLTGSVPAEPHLERAVMLARKTSGVRNVASLLVVKN
ncbi:MAG: BON domain-containing protein [Lacunisphaera sp.]|nr:BON domain-containing protein [Lacunisphaera sp.]